MVDGTTDGDLSVGAGRGESCDAPEGAGTIFVGKGGTGTLDIIHGAQVERGDGSIAMEEGSNGTVTLDGEGSIWGVIGRLFIGAIRNSDTDGGTALLMSRMAKPLPSLMTFLTRRELSWGPRAPSGYRTIYTAGTTTFSR